jgi:hypothetical protein
MKDLQHYLPLPKERRKEIWDQGLVALDANVLLDLYRLPEREREEVMMVFSHADVADRLWVPHQAMEEFLRNRLSVIHDQTVSANKLRDAADKAFGDFSKAISNARKHHPFFDASEWKQKIGGVLQELREKYDRDREAYPITLQDDPLLTRILQLLDKHVGGPFDEAESKEATKEAERRIKERIPPGYEDRKKDGRRPCGDYFIWRQILKKSGDEKQDVVFVTNDSKEDWLHRVGGQTIGPRPELRGEFHKAVGADQDIVFESLGRFVQSACARYSLDIDQQIALEEALEEAREQGCGSIAANFRMPNTFVVPKTARTSPRPTPRVLRDEPVTSEQMVEWFLENYKDPADGVPYDSAEGGYQYWSGGPYDAREEIWSQFPDASASEIDEAVSVVERNCFEWVRREDY